MDVRVNSSARGRAQADAQGQGDDGAGSEERDHLPRYIPVGPVVLDELAQIGLKLVPARDADEVVISAGHLEHVGEEQRPVVRECIRGHELIDQAGALVGVCALSETVDLVGRGNPACQIDGDPPQELGVGRHRRAGFTPSAAILPKM